MFSYWGTFVMQSDAKNSTCFPHAIDICEDCWFMVCPGGKFTVPSVNNKACNLSHHVLEKLGTLLWDTACMNLVARSCMKTNKFFFGVRFIIFATALSKIQRNQRVSNVLMAAGWMGVLS